MRPRNGDVAVALAHRFAIGEEEAMVGRKLRIERDVQQSHLPNREHPGNARERLGERSFRIADAHRAALLGDQNRTAGKKLKAPRGLQVFA